MNDDHYIQAADPAVQAMLNGEASIEVTKNRSISHIILGQPLRGYFAKKVKLPLMKALVLISKRYPQATIRNTSDKNTHAFIRVFEKFMEYEDNPEHPEGFAKHPEFGREPLFKAIFRIVLGESHDKYFGDRELALLDFILDEILDGNFVGRAANCPLPAQWKEPEPYGGQYSTINRLILYREEIKDMIRRPKEGEE